MIFATVLTDEITAFATVAVPMTALILFILSAIIDAKNKQLLKDINGTYLRTKEAELRFNAIEKHFDYLRDKEDSNPGI